jgi:hypothetical protein
MRLRLPWVSTVSTVSCPPRLAEFAVVTTASTPEQAAPNEAASFRSPGTGSAPASTSGW